MITVVPVGGLCNRMRAVDSGIALARATGQRLRVFWILNPRLNCRFDRLFVVPAAMHRLIQVPANNPVAGRAWQLYQRLSPRLYDLCLGEREIDELAAGKGDLARMVAGRDVLVLTYSRYFGRPPFFGDFRPAAPLQRQIDEFAARLDNVVGVHMRRTDQVVSIESSPTDAFVELMRKEVRQDAAVRFFVATDSPEDENRLRALFADRIVSRPKRSLDRNNAAAIEDALVDLYCLARCRKLIGSHWSSFTDTASAIGKMETIIARRTRAPDGGGEGGNERQDRRTGR